MAAPDFSKPHIQKTVKWFSKFHIFLYRLLGGHLVSGKGTVMLLTTTGRKSGLARTKPVMFVEEGDQIFCVASRGGSAKHPLWYKNLVKTPQVTVEVMGRGQESRTARTANSEERAAIWPRMTQIYGDFDAYQKRTDREIPVVVIEKTP
jgi:deazaflavin-dependent oxidoreductase (nitroreductase family)